LREPATLLLAQWNLVTPQKKAVKKYFWNVVPQYGTPP
jgi:hypothetical protein